MLIFTHKVEFKVPTARKRRALQATLDVTRAVYNAALEERSSAWSKRGVAITKADQYRSLTALKGDRSIAGLPVNLLRWPLAKLDLAFRGFFQRAKAGRNPGYPRFRAKDRFDTFGYTDRQCWKIDGRWLHLARIGSFRLRPHRPMAGELRSLQVKREGRRWYALIGIAVSTETRHIASGTAVGIDLGVHHHLTLSTGETVENQRVAARHASAVRRAQRRLARARRGSSSRGKRARELSALRRQEANVRRTRLHQISADLAARHELIVVEDLRITNMTRSARGTPSEPGRKVRQKAGLNRSILDAGWGVLVQMLSYKAERAGGRLIKVKPHGTSQECSSCGGTVPKALWQRRHVCACGADLDRDHNAALNVLHRGVAVPGDVNVGGCTVRRPGNVVCASGLGLVSN